MALTDYSFDPTEAALDPRAVDRKRLLADRLTMAGADTSPIQSHWQGLARMAQGLMGGYRTGEIDRQEQSQRKADQALIASYPGFSATPSAPTPLGNALQGKPVAAPMGAAAIDGGAEEAPQVNKPTPGAAGGAFGGLGFKPVGWDDEKPVEVASASPNEAVAGRWPQPAGVPSSQPAVAPVAAPQQVAQASSRDQEMLAWAKRAALSSNPTARALAKETLERIGKPDTLMNAGGGKLYNQRTGQWITAPETEKDEVKVLGRDGELYKIGPDGKPIILHKNASVSDVASIDGKTTDLLAERILQGDTKALVGLGRGAQGAANILQVQRRAAEIAAEKGIDAKGIITNSAQNAGLVSSARALGTKETHFGVAEKAMEESLPIAQAASDAVPRTDWLFVNKLVQAGQTQHTNPALKRFLIATDTAAKDYARTINPTGALRESDIEYARKILSTADGPEAYRQALDQLRIEASVMHRAIKRQKGELYNKPSEDHPAAPAAADPQEGKIARNPQTGETLIRKNGKWVPAS